MVKKNKWLYVPRERRDAESRIFIFPHSGCSAQGYQRWAQKLLSDDTVEVCIIQLPGRAERMNEECIIDMQVLIRDLFNSVSHLFDKPYVCFGHSLGSLVCFELMHKVKSNSLNLAKHIILSSKQPPHLTRHYEMLSHKTNEEIVSTLKNLDGTPYFILQDKYLTDILVPIIKNDFLLNENYTFNNLAPLDINMTILGAKNDFFVPYYELKEWEVHTTEAFNIKLYNGSHFYIYDYEDEIIDIIKSVNTPNIIRYNGP